MINKPIDLQFVNADFNIRTGVAKVLMRSPRYGDFEGKARLHPDDRPYISEFTGCEYAELRATIKYYKVRLKEVKSQLYALNRLKRTIESLKDYNKDSSENKRIRKMIYELNLEKNEWQKIIKVYEDYIINKEKTKDGIYKKQIGKKK